MKELMKRFIDRELDSMSKPPRTHTWQRDMKTQRHHLEGFGRAVMLYGDIDNAGYMQLRGDAYIAYVLGVKYAGANGFFEDEALLNTPSLSQSNEEIELFGSIEGADEAIQRRLRNWA